MPILRLALAQMDPTVGDLEANVATITRLRHQAKAHDVDLVVTPELSLLGYPPEDLLLKEGFATAARSALGNILASVDEPAVIVGTVLSDVVDGVALAHPDDGRDLGDARSLSAHLANGLVVVDDNRVVAKATKRHLPNYDVFDERRYFVPGVGEHTVLNCNGVAVGMLVCEDVWVPSGPAKALADAGASVLVVANASPYARGRRDDREAMLRERAQETGCWLVYVNMVGGQDELVFDGQSLVVTPTGVVTARAASFREELLVVDIDAPASAVGIRVGSPRVTAHEPSGLVNLTTEPRSAIEETYEALVTGTRDYLRKNGFRSAILGVSGGVDSALVAAIAVDAVGSVAVHGYALPSRYSSDHSLADAQALADNLDISLTQVPIESAHQTFAALLREPLDGEPSGLTDENLQSRIRGVLLMAISNATGAIVLTTGNKSEMATGYSTLYGDSAGGFAVIKDVSKTLVYELCHYRNERALRDGDVAPIPENILTKAPSAELRPDQRDDESLPPYDVLDPLLELYIERDATAEEMVSLDYDEALVARITRLVDRSEYKRRQMPPGVRISKKAFGRDRRMPITNGFQ